MKQLQLFIYILLSSVITNASGQTPVEANGRLSVVGTQLVNEHGFPIQLRGMSTHGIQWYGLNDCLTEASLDALAYDWGSDILRISLYIQEGGWETDPAGYEAQVNTLIQMATDRGMYALVDWHQLSPGDPNANTANAKAFFKNICEANASRNNIIYDIANEPNNVAWSAIKSYAEEMIPYIRQYDDDAVILCGTHGWGSLGVSDNWVGASQDIANNPVNATNFMYTFHFYATSHQEAYYNEFDSFSDQFPVFVTEWGSQEATGDGPNDFVMAQQYIDLMAEKKISWCNWNYSDDFRTGAVWKTGTCSNGPWTLANLKEAGVWVRDKILYPADDFPGVVETPQEPFNGMPISIPGIIEAEDYDLGGQDKAYNESTLENQGGSDYRSDAVDIEEIAGGYGVGYITDGEWLAYTVDVETTGDYVVDFLLAADDNFGGAFKLYLDDVEVMGATNSGTTGGWASFQPVQVTGITLTEGEHVLKFEAITGNFNLDKMTFTEESITFLSDSKAQIISIHPNPVSTVANINLPSNIGVGSLQIISLEGKVQKEHQGDLASIHSLDLSELEKGTYMCILQTDQGVFQSRFIKQ